MKTKLVTICLMLLLAIFVGGNAYSNDNRASTSASASHIAEPKITVYRPHEKQWISTDHEDIKPLDFLIFKGQALHVKAVVNAAQGQIATVPLGQASLDTLKSHIGPYDPDDLTYPQKDTQLVYAKWRNTDKWTYQPLGIMRDKQRFLWHGREFITKLNKQGARAVKPTGNVISTVNGVWGEHHDNQIHLTLDFPDIGETNKIITTHEHPFYVLKEEMHGVWIPAEDLKVGMSLQTCDGTAVQVAAWEIIDDPFTAYNIEVANAHTYFVADKQNLKAPPVLVHNDCLGKNWKPLSITDEANWNGCEACALKIKGRIGGEIHRLEPIGAPVLGPYRGASPNWGHHEVVVKNGRVYDAFGPSNGIPIDDYKELFEYPEAINFGF